MSGRAMICALALLSTGAVAWGAGASPAARALQETWRELGADASWRTGTVLERDALQGAMGALLRGAESCDPSSIAAASAMLEAVDMRVDERDLGGPVLVVREDRQHRGAGLFVVRCGPARPWIVQAPHSFYDLDTAGAVRELFVESQARIAMWNTVHRYGSREGEHRLDTVHPADVTREYGSLFHAATVAAVAAAPELRVLQLHGFDRPKLNLDAIVSTCSSDRPPTQLAQALGPVFGRVGAYGADVHTLGGTVNVQGRALSRLPDARFIHLELAPDLRARLRSDVPTRARFIAALDGAW